MITVEADLKEYFEKYKDKNFNKKQKGMRKNMLGMNFESYASRNLSVNEPENLAKQNPKKPHKNK